MKVLKLTLPASILAAILFTGGTFDNNWAEAQASTPITESAPARDVATPGEDISLTNSCIDSGKEKIYCLCVTKIFKNEMTLRQYRGAVALYKTENPKLSLTRQGYSDAELNAINTLKRDLSSDDMFRTRCDQAETYFSASSQSQN